MKSALRSWNETSKRLNHSIDIIHMVQPMAPYAIMFLFLGGGFLDVMTFN